MPVEGTEDEISSEVLAWPRSTDGTQKNCKHAQRCPFGTHAHPEGMLQRKQVKLCAWPDTTCRTFLSFAACLYKSFGRALDAATLIIPHAKSWKPNTGKAR